MLRRTNSSSHIPLPKSDARARSKSTVRASLRESGSIGGKNMRSMSMEKLPTLNRGRSSFCLPKKSTQLFTPTLPASASRNSLRTGLQGFKRSSSSLVTPCTSRPRSKSPFKPESTKKDKKWVSEQFYRVYGFLLDLPACQNLSESALKSLSINTFVFIMDALFKEIDPHSEITMQNYKECIPTKMKLYCYHSPISMSFLKTVNTKHQWPQVIGIFAFLVNLVSVVKRATAPEVEVEQSRSSRKKQCALNYIGNRYSVFNNDGNVKEVDNTYAADLERILGIDADKFKQLQEEVNQLRDKKEVQIHQLREIEEENTALKKEIYDIEAKIDNFYADSKEKKTDLDEKIKYLKERRTRINAEIKAKKERIAKLEDTIRKQSCTYEDKLKLETRIDEMKHTLSLKQEYLEARKEIQADFHLKIADLKKKVETEIYRLKTELMKPSTIEPELKTLQLHESDFMNIDFGNEIRNMNENKKRLETKVADEMASLKSSVANVKRNNDEMKQRVEATQEKTKTLIITTDDLNEQKKNYQEHMSLLKTKHEEEIKLLEQKIRNIEKKTPDLDKLRQQLVQINNLKEKEQETLEAAQKQTLKFFDDLEREVADNFEQINEMRNIVVDHVESRLNAVHEEENNILEDVLKLLPMKKGEVK